MSKKINHVGNSIIFASSKVYRLKGKQPSTQNIPKVKDNEQEKEQKER